MRQFPYAGPGLVVLVASAAALVAAPFAIRRANDSQATADIVLASRILDGNAASASSKQRAGGASADQSDAGQEVHEPILEQINRAHRAIAKLVEPSVVHVSTLTTMQRRMFTAPYASSGSGWIWDEDGHIVTNAHVIGASEQAIPLKDGTKLDWHFVCTATTARARREWGGREFRL